VTNGNHLGYSLFLPVRAVNCTQTLKASIAAEIATGFGGGAGEVGGGFTDVGGRGAGADAGAGAWEGDGVVETRPPPALSNEKRRVSVESVGGFGDAGFDDSDSEGN